jgi:hypothetical protein
MSASTSLKQTTAATARRKILLHPGVVGYFDFWMVQSAIGLILLKQDRQTQM